MASSQGMRPVQAKQRSVSQDWHASYTSHRSLRHTHMHLKCIIHVPPCTSHIAHCPHASLTPHTHTAHTSNTHAHTHTTSSRQRGELGGREQLPRDPAGQLLGPPPTDTESEPRRAGMTCPRSQSMLVAELPRFLKNQVQPVGGRRAQSSARFPSQFTPLLGGRSIEEGHSSMTPSLSAALNLCLLP